MLKRKFDFSQPIDVALYLRMSSDKQNPKSPQQQRERIQNIIENRNLPWRIVEVYQDDAISGKYARKRPQFMKMMNDISSGAINVGAILVDTIERFGRMEDLDSRRKRLLNRHGVVILTADRNFSDPYTPEGHAMTAIENLRAYDANRIKANDVVRGKIGSIEDGYWPGGPVPFGYRLELADIEKRHRREVKHHVLVFDEVTGPIMLSMLVQSASKPSWGQDRLTGWLNDRPDIPDELKPFHASTIGKRLRNPIYRGILVWSEYSQGVVDDRRVLEKNDERDIIRVEGFCEPIAPVEILKQVDANIELRKKFRPDSEAESSGTKRGVNYSHPLTGLVRCGHCGASMVPNSTSPYTTKSGETRNYCSYMCPNGRTKACQNKKRIKEEWLRQVVIEKIVQRLAPDEASIAELVEETRQMVLEQQRLSKQESKSNLPQLHADLESLEEQIRGWAETLAKSNLHRRLRESLEAKSNNAYGKIDLIEQAIAESSAEENVLQVAVQAGEVRSSLSRLHEKILADCPTSANLELSMHLDKIECFEDGQVTSRICKLGSSPIAVQWFGGSEASTDLSREGVAGAHRVKPRRRALLRLEADDGDFDELLDRIHTATDPNRFAGLPEHWFWVDEFKVPKKISWVHENAQRVLERYQEIKASGKKPILNAMAREFGKSRPTISRALDIATEVKSGEKPEHRREPKSVKGNPELEAQIARMHDSGSLNSEIAKAFGLGRSTVTKALDRLYLERGIPRPDGRKTRHD
jgi:DNA invertase Pin-like site-specific DNA recombinase